MFHARGGQHIERLQPTSRRLVRHAGDEIDTEVAHPGGTHPFQILEYHSAGVVAAGGRSLPVDQ